MELTLQFFFSKIYKFMFEASRISINLKGGFSGGYLYHTSLKRDNFVVSF
jgi:hypothetical protein